tara:strand:- start:58 stop:1137 length:1080 start_codon:yes stop_codon:yes gene_type:complete
MQKTTYNSKSEFNKYMSLAHSNDDPENVLEKIYDSEFPYPHFPNKLIGFRKYRDYATNKYAERNNTKNKSYVFEDFEEYIPGNDQSPLTPQDYIITSCITTKDHKWPAPYVYNNWHFSQTHKANKDRTFIQPNQRPYFADILLGLDRKHRNTFFELLQENDMLEKNIVNLFSTYRSPFLDSIDNKAQNLINTITNDLSGKLTSTNSTTTTLDGTWVSQIICKPIMESSWISVIAETISNNDCFFVTEKTAKPLMAGRPFIILSGMHTLRHLRSLGFKTFSPVIDESYDEISDQDQRIKAAFESFAKLSTQDSSQMYAKLMPILEHNQEIMYDKSKLCHRARNFLDNLYTRYASDPKTTP